MNGKYKSSTSKYPWTKSERLIRYELYISCKERHEVEMNGASIWTIFYSEYLSSEDFTYFSDLRTDTYRVDTY